MNTAHPADRIQAVHNPLQSPATFLSSPEPSPSPASSSTSSTTSSTARKRRYNEISTEQPLPEHRAKPAEGMTWFTSFVSTAAGYVASFLGAARVEDEVREVEPDGDGGFGEDEGQGHKAMPLPDQPPEFAPSNEGLLRARHVGNQSVDTSQNIPTTQGGNHVKRARKLSVGTKEPRPALKNGGLPSPLPSEDGISTVPVNNIGSGVKTSNRRAYTQHKGIFDIQTQPYLPTKHTIKTNNSLSRTLQKRDRRDSKTANTRPRRLIQGPSAAKTSASPMGQTFSNLRTSRFGSSKEGGRALSPLSEKRRTNLDRLREVQGSPGINKRSPKASPRASINLKPSYSAKALENADLELLVILQEQAYTDGFLKKSELDRNLEERNKALQKLMKEKAAAAKTAVPPLKPSLRARAKELLKLAARPEHKFVNEFTIEITGHDLIRLRPQAWLNDSLIEFYLALISQREKAKGHRVEYFNSYFWKSYDDHGYAKVNRHAKRKKFPGKEMLNIASLLIPINVGGAHWTLAIINVEQKKFEFWDSLGQKSQKQIDKYCIKLRDYFCAETGKTKEQLEQEGWTFYGGGDVYPQQDNGYDCGVYTVKTAEFRARGREPIYTPKDVERLREQMVVEICDKKMMPVPGEEGFMEGDGEEE